MSMEKLAIHGGKPVSARKISIAKPVFSDETISDVAEVLRSGNVRQGSKTLQFEREFKEKVGARYAYAVNSGTAALHVAYLSMLGKGDEVIVPAFTFIATASTVALAFGRPVFADIDEETLTIDPEDAKKKITSKTRAIAPVHIFGNAADIKVLREIADDHELFLVNDAAQAHGTQIDGKDVGSFDDANCYSFYPTKTLTTGEGGIVTTNDSKLFELGKVIRSHGEQTKYNHVALGLNYRMTDITAVIGLNQLRMLDEWIAKRRKNAEFLTRNIKKIEGLKPQKVQSGVRHSYSYYTIVMDLERFRCSRDEFVEAVQAENVECSVHYPIPLTRQPVFKRFSKTQKCPVSEDIAERVFSIPVHPQLNEEELRKIIEAVNKVANNYLK